MMQQNGSSKLGFWAVFALVTGSQIGSAVFMLPANLAPYGWYSIGGWLISGTGAIALALVFAQLCSWFPKTGGPHAYVQHAFGDTAAFFTGWTYWVISWVSSTVVIMASVGYLMPLFGTLSSTTTLCVSLLLLAVITILNLYGVSTAGRAEFVLTLMKAVPLLIIPICTLFFFDSTNFQLSMEMASLSVGQIISRVTLLTLWGFIGVESATTAAGAVENPSKTIPRAVVAGTAAVACLYIMNSLGIMGAIPGAQLALSNAPYADATRMILGGSWHIIISLIASIICIGTLNAWTLVSGQIVLGLAEDGFMPAWFAKKNRYNAPVWGIVTSSMLIVPLLILTSHQTLAQQILTIVDFSVTAFLFIYLICSIAFLTVVGRMEQSKYARYAAMFYGVVAILFCTWIIYEMPWYVNSIATLFVISGLPFYIWFRVK